MTDDIVNRPANNSQPIAAKARIATWLRRPWVKYALVAGAAIAIVVVGIQFYSNRPIPVQVASIQENVPVRVFGLGRVEARILSKVGFEVGAALVEVKADHGDHVKKGDVLARLAAGQQDAKVAKARAALLIAEANINKSESNLNRARAVLAQRQESNRRKQTLVGRGVVSKETAEEALRDEAVAQADVAVAKSEIEVMKAQQADAKAQIRFEETMLQHRTLAAPFDALVIERHLEPGTVVKPGDPAFTLIDDGSIWGLAFVDEARAGFIKEGQRVDARLRSRPQDHFTGRVARIGLESDRVTEERRVFIKGDNKPPRVYLGEQVEFWITVARLEKALLVPEAAVKGFDGREGTVWTVEDGRLQKRLVQIRHRTEDARLEIVDGVPKDASVVSRIEKGFRTGRPVRVDGAGKS